MSHDKIYKNKILSYLLILIAYTYNQYSEKHMELTVKY